MERKKHLRQYGMVCILSMAMLVFGGCGDEKEEAETMPETQLTVETAVVQPMDIIKSVDYTGVVAGKNEIDVSAEASARVAAIYVHPGDTVSAGQKIAVLDTKDYVNGVALAQDNYQQALAAKRTNEVNLQSAQNTYNRIRSLYESGAATQQELENAQSALDLLSTGSADVAVSIAETNLKNAENQLAKCTITAPIGGMIGDVAITEGQMVSNGMKVAVITDASQFEVQLNVSESDISYIQQGNPVQVSIKSAREEAFDGVVSSIAAVTDAGSAGYSVKVDVNDANHLIKSGMFAKVMLDTRSSLQTMALPINAVISKAGQSYVYLATEEGRAHQVEVVTGIRNQDYIEIVSGLEYGQEIITAGNTLVSEGSRIKVLNEEEQ